MTDLGKYIIFLLPIVLMSCEKKNKEAINEDVSHLITGKQSNQLDDNSDSDANISSESISNDSNPSSTDHKTVVSFSAVDIEVDEPSSGRSLTKIVVAITPPITESITVKFETEFITASSEDVDTGTNQIIIPPSNSNFIFPIDILGDNIDENTETLKVKMLSTDIGIIDTLKSELNISITDSDDDAKLSFKTDFVQVAEGSGFYEASIIISPPVDKDVNLSFKTTGIASINQDYNILTEDPITVPKLQDEFFIELEILSDTIPEGGENIIIELLPPSNANVGENNILTIQIPGDISLNDTGVTTWYNGTDFSSTVADPQYPNQDAEFGHDPVFPNNDDGFAGFSYTKIDDAGNALPASATNFNCVYDNRSNLLWSIHDDQQDLPSIRGKSLNDFIIESIKEGNYPYHLSHAHFKAKNYIYYWKNMDAASNGGNSGALGERFPNNHYPILPECAFAHKDMGSYSTQTQYCNTTILVDAFNSLAICGAKNWRLPTIEELRSLFNYGLNNNDTVFFKHMMKADYISSTPSINNTGATWCLNFSTSQVKMCNKQSPHHVRLVRGNEQ